MTLQEKALHFIAAERQGDVRAFHCLIALCIKTGLSADECRLRIAALARGESVDD